MANPPLITVPFATSGDQSVIPATDPNGFVNYQTGYTPDYEINLAAGDPQAKAVERGVQNYLFNALTTGLQQWQFQNRPAWYASMPGGYARWAEVMFPTDGSATPRPYRSLVAANVAQPGSSANWEYIQGTGEMIQNIPMPSGGPSGPASLLVNVATDFNTFTGNGSYQFQSDSVVQSSPNNPVNGGNKGGAGMLEVMTWNNGASVYTTQFFRDRNGLGFMRGASNGSWSVWKIWANAQQFTPGDTRMWYGTATEAAVQAAWGPGWHLCNGQNGTPDLRGLMPIGAGGSFANGATGGSNSVTLAAANIPAHNHVAVVSDPGHVHSVSQSPHAHGVSDPGHAHGVFDPGHAHANQQGGWVQAGQDNGGASALSGPNQYGVYNNQNGAVQPTFGAGTGIGIFANGTGIGIFGANANIAIAGAATGITVTTQNTGSGTAFNVTPPYMALSFVMYTGS
jgi:hypothetical protein